MTNQHHIQLTEAAAGDERAVAELFMDLRSHDLDVQMDAIQEIKLCKNVRFWKLALEFEVFGSWAGRPVPGYGSGDVAACRIREFVEDFLEYDGDDKQVLSAQKQALLESAHAGPADLRAHAVRLLGVHHFDDPATRETLTHALADSAAAVRISAASALGRIGDGKAIRELASHLNDPDYQTRHRARVELSSVGEPAVPALKAVLQHSTGQARWEAVKGLSGIHSEDAARTLALCLLDENPGIRSVAADGLALMPEYAIVPVLELLKKDGDSAVLRSGARQVFSRLSHNGFLPHALGRVLYALRTDTLAEIMPVEASAALDSIRPGLKSIPQPKGVQAGG